MILNWIIFFYLKVLLILESTDKNLLRYKLFINILTLFLISRFTIYVGFLKLQNLMVNCNFLDRGNNFDIE